MQDVALAPAAWSSSYPASSCLAADSRTERQAASQSRALAGASQLGPGWTRASEQESAQAPGAGPARSAATLHRTGGVTERSVGSDVSVIHT